MGRLYRYVSQNLPRRDDVLRRRTPILSRNTRERSVLLDRVFRNSSIPARARRLDAQNFQRPHRRRVEIGPTINVGTAAFGCPASAARRGVSRRLRRVFSSTTTAKSPPPGQPPPAPNKNAAGTPYPRALQSAARTTESATKARESAQIFPRRWPP